MSESHAAGLDVRPPTKSCEDPNCPFHGRLRVRGRLLSGRAVSINAKNMIVVQRESYKYNSKYLRYFKQRNRLHAHLPRCLEVALGDTIALAECRPLSKTISFVAVERIPTTSEEQVRSRSTRAPTYGK